MKSSGNFWRKYRWCWKCAERAFATEKLIHYFRQIPDYRCGREKKHDLAEMLVCVTLVKQVRIPSEKDSQGNDVTPSKEEFLEKGSRRVPAPSAEEGTGKDVQCTALISDLILTAEELGNIKRMHWSIENRLHHVLDDTFREDRSPAKKSRNNLSLIRKYAYNILRMAMYETGLTNIMTEMMDCFCDNAALRERYVFQGIASLY